MTTPAFEDIGACVFDAYGTLFDFNSAVEHCRDEIGECADELSALWRQKQLQYTWLRSLMGRYVDFWQVTGDALDFAMQATGIENPQLRAKLMELYLQLDAYPEVADVLVQLKAAGKKTAILSLSIMGLALFIMVSSLVTEMTSYPTPYNSTMPFLKR